MSDPNDARRDAYQNKMRSKNHAAIVAQGFTSYMNYMNATKWRELCQVVINEMPFQPRFEQKDLDGDVIYAPLDLSRWQSPGEWRVSPTYGSLSFGTEWIRVSARLVTPVGQLFPPRVQDCTEEFVAILKRIGIPYVREDDGCILIYGHGKSVDFSSD